MKTDIGISNVTCVQTWMDDAQCVHYDPELWFSPIHTTRITLALAVCGECVVRAECLTYARTNDLRYGIFGGLTAQQRHQLTKHTYNPAKRETE